MNFHSLRFDRAAKTYGEASHIQAAMADILMGIYPPGLPPGLGRGVILEMGCGTGHLTRRLAARFPAHRIVATDASPNMLEESRRSLGQGQGKAEHQTRNPGNLGTATWARMDAEGPVPEGVNDLAPYPLLASNALVQWFPDLARHLGLVAGLLEPNGHYLVSGFSRGNFPELNAILREPPFSFDRFPGHERRDVEDSARKAGMDLMAWKEDWREEVFPSPGSFLQRVKGLGAARRPERGIPLTRLRLRHLEQAYRERYGVEGGVKATWKPWYALLRKTG